MATLEKTIAAALNTEIATCAALLQERYTDCHLHAGSQLVTAASTNTTLGAGAVAVTDDPISRVTALSLALAKEIALLVDA